MRKFILRCLNYVGYHIVKIQPRPFRKKDHVIKVADYEITMPYYNPLISVYKTQTEFNSEICRLVNVTANKYPGLTCIDIGANVGDTVAIVKSQQKIPMICIEGDNTTFEYLKKNTAQFNDVKIFKQFLGEKDSAIKANLDKKGWNTTIVPASDSANTIDIKKLDTLFEQEKLDVSSAKFLKIDTEGFDTIIIRGALQFISDIKPVVYFEYNRDNMTAINEDGLSTLNILEQHGYSKILIYDDRGRFIASTDLTNKELIKQLHNYANGKDGLIYYYNFCLFHSNDSDVAEAAIKNEEKINM